MAKRKNEGLNFFGTIVPWDAVRRHINVRTGLGALFILMLGGAAVANANPLDIFFSE